MARDFSALLRPGTLLRYGVSLGVLGWLAWQVDWRELRALERVDWPLALAALGLAGVAYPLQAWRWQRLLTVLGIVLPARLIHATFWVGNFYNSFLPGGIAGDGVRIYQIARAAPQHGLAIAASVVADRLLGFFSLLALAVLALGAHLLTHGGARELQLLLAASAGALALVAAIMFVLGRAEWWEAIAARALGAERAGALRAAASSLAARPAALLFATGVSIVVWLLDFAALALLARACGLAIGPLEFSVAAAAAYVAAMLPLSIGGHGVREGALVAVLGWIASGSDPERVWLLALAFWSVTIAWSVAGVLGLAGLPAGKFESASVRGAS